MAITDINISEQLETDAPSIKYTGNEGPQASPQHQQEMMIAQQIWEALGPEQQGQFQSFEQFFQSGVWKQILQQMQADEGQAQGPQPGQAQGIAGLGPRNMEQQMPMPNRMGAEYGGRIGFQRGHDTELMKMVQFFMSEFGMSEDQAIKQATSRSEGKFPRPEIRPDYQDYQAPLRQMPMPMERTGSLGRRQIEDVREPQLGIESLRGRR